MQRRIFDYDLEGQRVKKLVAGVRYSLFVTENPGKAFKCDDCSTKMRKQRNCGNFKGLAQVAFRGRERDQATALGRPAFKKGDLSLYECPSSFITSETWSILRLVNHSLHPDGYVLRYPNGGSYFDQEPWMLDAIDLVIKERNEHHAKNRPKINSPRSTNES